MRDARPLTAKEKRQLDSWDQNLERGIVRAYVVGGVLGFLGGAWLAWSMASETLAAGGTVRSLAADYPVLGGLERALGPVVADTLLVGIVMAAAMLAIVWRLHRVIRRMQAQFRARYVAAGAEGERAPAP